jgi:20S proteasome, alpha and beta subunits
MSLGVAFKGSEGIVLAADSRVTIPVVVPIPGVLPAGVPNQMIMPATYDNATKLLKIAGQDHVAAVTFGVSAVGHPELRTAHSLIPEFEAGLKPNNRLSTEEFAKQLSKFFLHQWNTTMPPGIAGGQQMTFLVGGYDPKAPYGRIFEINIPDAATPVEKHGNSFGIQWGGQRELTSRMLNGHDPGLLELIKNKFSLDNNALAAFQAEIEAKSAAKIPYQFLPLQDCVDLSILLIRTTSRMLGYETNIRGVGGSVDVAIITRQEGFHYVQRKEIRGEREDQP